MTAHTLHHDLPYEPTESPRRLAPTSRRRPGTDCGHGVNRYVRPCIECGDLPPYRPTPTATGVTP